MKKIDLATAVTTAVTVAAVSRLRVVEAFGPARLSLPANMRSMASKLARCLRRQIDNRVAAAIAYHETKVAPATPGDLCDGELRNFGAYRRISGSAGNRYRRAKFGSQVLRVAR
jgi:hypothetical protein